MKFFDQSSNATDLTAQEATAPVICSAGSVFNSDWGLSINMDGGKKFSGSALAESFTIHYRAEFDATAASKYLLRQSDDAVYIKATNLYIDEIAGADDVTILVNEDYYTDYTTQNITIPASSGQLITVEFDVTSGSLGDPLSYTIEDIDLFHTMLVYTGTKSHVRRHTTNQILSEDIPSLQEKLKKFSPQSFYNLFYGAKAIFGMFSFAGLINDDPVTLIRAKVTYGSLGQYITADVLANNSGYITLDSPVANISGGPSGASSISVLGELVGNPAYNDPANLGHNDAVVERWYSQAIQYPGIYATPHAVGNEPRFYDSSTSSLDVSTDDGICGLNFVSRTGQDDCFLDINSPFNAKSVVAVYQNNDNTADINGITGGNLNQGVSLFSRNNSAGFNSTTFQDGVGVRSASSLVYAGSLLGKNTDVNVAGLYLADTAKKVVVNEQEIDISYIDDTPLPNSPNGMKFHFVGGAESYHLDGKLFAAIYYEDDRYPQEQEIQDYMNILFRAQNNPISAPNTNPYIADYSYGKPANSPATTDPFQFNVTLLPQTSWNSNNRVEQDDLLLVSVFYDAKSGGNSSPGTTPVGWTKLLDISSTPDTDLGGSVYYRRAVGTETDSSNLVQFEIDNPQGDITECIWFSHRIKNAATTGTVIESSTVQSAIDSDTITALAISKPSDSSDLAMSFAVADTGYAQGQSVGGTGWGSPKGTFTSLSADAIAARWAFKEAEPGETSTYDAEWTMSTFNQANGDRIAFQLLINELQAAGSPGPSGDEQTWSFSSDAEGWSIFNGSLSILSSHTPSSDTSKSGILEVTDSSSSITCSISLDFSTLTWFDNTQPLYYEIVFSVPSAGDFTGVQKVLYGNGGSEVFHTSPAPTQDVWTTINGELTTVGSSDEIVIFFTPTTSVSNTSKIYIDSIKFSHTDFR